ncbi:hypothetical protein R6Q59_029076 [Mikania micrantha]|uniref:Cytochrome P450 n=1 Tax=Mikania micrantha TaxID=192012 RepID=A0A5N6LWJ4_9ASTR|nr:hypothetical protein E3N88_39287 [Mikania micrantha]
MQLPYLFLLLLPIISFLHLLPKIIKRKQSFNRPPGPHGLPFIGNLHQIDQSSLHTSLWNLTKPYGPIVSLRFGFNSAVVISSASLAKEILQTQDLVFCDRPLFTSQRKMTYNGIDIAFSSYNQNWRDMRKIFSLHLFSPRRVQSFRFIREDEVSSAMKTLHDRALSSEKINLIELMKNLMNNVMLRVCFGERYQDVCQKSKVLGLIDEVQEHLVYLCVSDIWPGLPFGGLVDRLMGKMSRLKKCSQDLDSFFQQLIDEHMIINKQKHDSYKEFEDVIDVLLQLAKDKFFNLTHEHIKAMLMDVLVAGTDTVAATVVWAMSLLINNPKAMKKAQEEVRNVIGIDGKLDEDHHLPRLTYLKAVIKETMRLYPPAPLLVPRETRKDAIVNGYEIKQKTLVYVNAWAIGRDPKSWDKPELFLPERFLGRCDIDIDINFKGNHNDFELIPFGAGRRICPGMSTGDVMLEVLLANFLYMFDWGLPKDEVIDFDTKPGITMHKRNQLCLLPKLYFENTFEPSQGA